MQYQIQSLQLTTGYFCKYCHNTIAGQYVFLDGEMFFKGQCKCSFWLVKSTYLNQTFNYFRVV